MKFSIVPPESNEVEVEFEVCEEDLKSSGISEIYVNGDTVSSQLWECLVDRFFDSWMLELERRLKDE